MLNLYSKYYLTLPDPKTKEYGTSFKSLVLPVRNMENMENKEFYGFKYLKPKIRDLAFTSLTHDLRILKFRDLSYTKSVELNLLSAAY